MLLRLIKIFNIYRQLFCVAGNFVEFDIFVSLISMEERFIFTLERLNDAFAKKWSTNLITFELANPISISIKANLMARNLTACRRVFCFKITRSRERRNFHWNQYERGLKIYQSDWMSKKNGLFYQMVFGWSIKQTRNKQQNITWISRGFVRVTLVVWNLSYVIQWGNGLDKSEST